MHLLYGVITTILYPVLILIIFIRKFLKKEDKLRYKEKFFILILILTEVKI